MASDLGVPRRAFLRTAAMGALAWSTGLLRVSAQSGLGVMLAEVIALGRRLRRQEISPLDWQDAIGPTLRGCGLDALRDGVELARARRRTPIARRGAAVVRVTTFDDLRPDEGAAMRLFFFEAGRTDPPHCHFNTVTAHIVLEGRFRVRHYERLRELSSGFVLQPTRDRTLEPGDVTSISELRENAHWHAAITRGVLLDVEQGRLDPSLPPRRREMVELTAPLPDGSILAPRIPRARALRLYG